MSVCKNCGADLIEGACFCMKCGSKIENEVICSKCGTKLPQEALFCYKCGTSVGSEFKKDDTVEVVQDSLNNTLKTVFSELDPVVVHGENYRENFLQKTSAYGYNSQIFNNRNWLLVKKDKTLLFVDELGKKKNEIDYSGTSFGELIGFNSYGVWSLSQKYGDKLLSAEIVCTDLLNGSSRKYVLCSGNENLVDFYIYGDQIYFMCEEDDCLIIYIAYGTERKELHRVIKTPTLEGKIVVDNDYYAFFYTKEDNTQSGGRINVFRLFRKIDNTMVDEEEFGENIITIDLFHKAILLDFPKSYPAPKTLPINSEIPTHYSKIQTNHYVVKKISSLMSQVNSFNENNDFLTLPSQYAYFDFEHCFFTPNRAEIVRTDGKGNYTFVSGSGYGSADRFILVSKKFVYVEYDANCDLSQLPVNFSDFCRESGGKNPESKNFWKDIVGRRC